MYTDLQGKGYRLFDGEQRHSASGLWQRNREFRRRRMPRARSSAAAMRRNATEVDPGKSTGSAI
jgi:hypothetical protein